MKRPDRTTAQIADKYCRSNGAPLRPAPGSTIATGKPVTPDEQRRFEKAASNLERTIRTHVNFDRLPAALKDLETVRKVFRSALGDKV